MRLRRVTSVWSGGPRCALSVTRNTPAAFYLTEAGVE